MAFSNDRARIFRGTEVSHRGKTLTDIGRSKKYRSYINQVFDASNSKIAIISNEFAGRPDLIAYAAYGTELLWWLIVEANSVFDYEEDLKAGKQILIPQI